MNEQSITLEVDFVRLSNEQDDLIPPASLTMVFRKSSRSTFNIQ